jgi:recombination endonuclease VII
MALIKYNDPRYQSEYYKANREKKLEYAKEYRNRPEVKKKIQQYHRIWESKNKELLNERQKVWIKAHPDSVKNWWLRRRYGISKADFDLMMMEQGGLCALCGLALEGKFGVDHDHKTGRVRGILHNNCNVILGMAKDDPILLRKATSYLEGWA